MSIANQHGGIVKKMRTLGSFMPNIFDVDHEFEHAELERPGHVIVESGAVNPTNTSQGELVLG